MSAASRISPRCGARPEWTSQPGDRPGQGGSDRGADDAGVDNSAHRCGFQRDAGFGNQTHGVGRCSLLRPPHEPIERSAGVLAADCGTVPAEPGVHQHAGQRAGADPNLVGLLLQCRVIEHRRGEW